MELLEIVFWSLLVSGIWIGSLLQYFKKDGTLDNLVRYKRSQL